jgi:hypothetical protein
MRAVFIATAVLMAASALFNAIMRRRCAAPAPRAPTLQAPPAADYARSPE